MDKQTEGLVCRELQMYFFTFAVISENETQKEMPGVGREVLGKIAELNQKAKEVKKSSERIKERKEKEKRAFVQETDLASGGSSDSVEVEELVPPTPSKYKIFITDKMRVDSRYKLYRYTSKIL